MLTYSMGQASPADLLPGDFDREQLLVLAGEIVQAHSALFLLVKSSQAPDLGLLESTTTNVGEWISELGDRLAGVRHAHDAGSMDRLHQQLVRTHQTLQRFVPFRARRAEQVTAAMAMKAIADAHQLLRLARRGSETFTDILATCCAADVTDIAQRRNNV